jgi:hypothetical protein
MSAERNKEIAQAFYDLMFNQSKPAEALDRFAGDEYIQHNPEVADEKQAFIDYFDRMAREYPGKRVTFKTAATWIATTSATSATSPARRCPTDASGHREPASTPLALACSTVPRRASPRGRGKSRFVDAG